VLCFQGRDQTLQSNKIIKYWPIAAITVLVLLFFYQLAFTNLILARGDTYVYFYPYWDARDAALSAGQLPQWTNELFMGAPLLANPQLGTFYPPNWLTIPFNAPDSIRISILLHSFWATLGAYLLARRTLKLDELAALTAAIIFGLGGHVGAHVEQINQLQSLAWMPWLLMLFNGALANPRRYLPLLGIAWAMQLLCGHTQVVFMSGVLLGIYGIGRLVDVKIRADTPIHPYTRSFFRVFIILSVAAISAIMLSLPQLLPTQELVSLSNRSEGFNQSQVTAFSLNPLLTGRGLLPSYDGQPFSEYIAYAGIIGFGLALVGLFSGHEQRRLWLAIVVIGLIFALGRNTFVYWYLAALPGFNLFRVPARWLALFSLGVSMLAGIGVQSLADRKKTDKTTQKPIILLAVVVCILGAAALLSEYATEEVYGPANPTLVTFAGWFVALLLFIGVYFFGGRQRTNQAILLCMLVVAELWLASQKLPYNDLSDPAVYEEARFTINQMRAYNETEPGRILSISDYLFDLGDENVLDTRWREMGLNERAIAHAFTATKLQETVGGNILLKWGVPTIDGFGGGILPTQNYSAFTSLMLPDGMLRTIDGRLQNLLSQADCPRGTCIPEQRWLNLSNTRYLLTDKVYDVVYQGIFYDTQLETRINYGQAIVQNPTVFEGDELHVLYSQDGPLASVEFQLGAEEFVSLQQIADETTLNDGLLLQKWAAENAAIPQTIRLSSQTETHIRAMTLVDSRTGDFVQLTPPGWQRLYSADVKIYENLEVLPRAFVVHNAIIVPDSWSGTEQALSIMRDSRFDPGNNVVLITDSPDAPHFGVGRHILFDAEPLVTISEYSATRVVVEVEASRAGYLLLTDAYYPGWQAEINGESVPIYRADVMFRAVPIEEGTSTVVFTYRNDALRLGVGIWIVFVGLFAGVFVWGWRKSRN
jgi:hypothetical protein